MKTVAYVVQDTKSAQFRYRVKNVAEALEGSKAWRVIWVLKSELSKIDFDKTDLIMFLRQTAKDEVALDFIQRAHGHNTRVFFDLDDLIFDYRDLLTLMRGTGSRNIFYWLGYFWGIRRIAKKVDGFIATNEFLASKLRRSFKKPVQVIRNSLNQKQIEVSNKCLPKKLNPNFTIGYFSGSPTHQKDFELIEPEIVRFLTKHKETKLVLVGYMKLSSTMDRLRQVGQVEVLAPVDYLKLQKLISRVDVNIAPLVLNDFTNCKSELKFFEAAIVETTTIASPSFAFKNAIKDGENGFLAEPGEWFEKLEYLYQHPEENIRIARNARKSALENYYGKTVLNEIEQAYNTLMRIK